MNAHVIDGNITPPDPDLSLYSEDDDDYYDDDYSNYPYTFNDHLYKYVLYCIDFAQIWSDW